jgi:predicted TIM-barrel fold metal-dependent hydrolase
MPQCQCSKTIKKPAIFIPAKACDCHMHVFGPLEQYPCSLRRSYTPRVATLDDWAAMATKLGLQRQVFVQASAYGADNRCMLDAMRAAGGRCRGVAVIDEETSEAALWQMHEAGVRGVRVNAATFGVKDPRIIADEIERTIDRVRPLRWHVQIFAGLAAIDALAQPLAHAKVPIVIDHMGLARAELGTGQPGFASLIKLPQMGHCWVKLSGAYRVSSLAPDYRDALPIAQALIAANPKRLVWGTDWPHTGEHKQVASGEVPLIDYRPLDDGFLLELLAAWCADAAEFKHIFVDNPAELYEF